jgi:hypothetical protein
MSRQPEWEVEVDHGAAVDAAQLDAALAGLLWCLLDEPTVTARDRRRRPPPDIGPAPADAKKEVSPKTDRMR